MRRAGAWAAAAMVAVLAIALGFASPAEAKSFSLAEVTVEATLRPDASMSVVEHVTYDFEGSFSFAGHTIPTGDYEVRDVAVHERGEPISVQGSPYDFTWYFSAEDEQKTFDISYVVDNVAKVGPDVGELYWKWIGEAHPEIAHVRVHLATPGPAGQVKAWAHGPLDGLVTINGADVDWAVDGVNEGTFVEGRVAVPAQSFDVAPSGEARLPVILEQEQKFADEANAKRERIRLLNRIWWLAPALGLLMSFAIWWKWGKEPKVQDIGEYWREPLDDPPAVVATMLQWGTVPAVAMSATIVDLAQRGALKIEETRQDRLILPDKTDWKFTRTDVTPSDLRPFEKRVLDQLFVAGPETSQSQQIEWAKAHQSRAREFWEQFEDQVKEDYAYRGYQETGRIAPYALNILTAVGLGFYGFTAFGVGALGAGLAAILAAVIVLAMTIPLRKRTGPGALRATQWKAFRHFLKDFSHLHEAQVAALVMWERYLVYAVALGVTEEVAKGLAARIPPEQQQSFAPWYVGYHGGGGMASSNGFGSFSTFGDSYGSTMRGAYVPSSSGSGGGGGFSGGGGGGGGGSGFSAG